MELDAYKNFDELKPWWCEGLLQERTDKNGSTKFYVNFGRTCGCNATQTTMVTLHKKATIRGDGVTCFVNSTELRHIVSEEGITESKSSAGDSTWKLDRVEEVCGEDYCR